MGCPSWLLGFSPLARSLSWSGLCEKQDAAAQEGHPIPSSQPSRLRRWRSGRLPEISGRLRQTLTLSAYFSQVGVEVDLDGVPLRSYEALAHLSFVGCDLGAHLTC